ncbi:SusC/RagA family TonB-linked outer membrane protein [Pedobacter sp. MC2016-14]|uniref:SusC/RagA family TonB-linked outer membrane protein n=1 Tax=Pedobacter sp. MC2016-14 TaxID=2897327 RepID=UPI001E3E2DE1|nr:SusC/RagA family TonB-linked outer membrane protein [Pedobacter sp. MC2016-14]MCD0488647.1 SusC/RagA family TonB-linked outer membrane protein [Pedobacter sp. MC2016-14]
MKFSAITAEGRENCIFFAASTKSRFLIRQLMRISLITAILWSTSINCLFALDSKAQSLGKVQVTLEFKNESVLSVLKKIEQSTPFRFMYRNTELKALKSISLSSESRSVEELLNLILVKDGFSYEQVGSQILISKSKTPAAMANELQQVRVTGMVTDEDGGPLPGVTIRVKGNNSISTATDLNGHFNINVADKSTVLIFSYVGFISREVVIGDQTSLKVELKASAGSLNEVVVIGYGTAVRKDLTGSVSSISAETIAKQPVGNVLNSMQGRMAGVQVAQSNGLPGSGVSITIRGRNSLLSGNLPLYIVDGVPFTFYNSIVSPPSDNLNGTGIYAASSGISPFNSLNPNDVESISVLKDADATAIYGARGANGVVLITTKKGKAGKTKLDLNVSSGIGKVGHYIPMLSGEEYLALRKEAFANDNVAPNITSAPDLLSWSQTEFTNWQKTLIGGTAKYTDAQATLSGGNENTNFTFGTGYHKESTVYPGDSGQDRFSGRMNVQHTSTNKKFYALFSTTYSNDVTDLPSTDLAGLYNLPPNYNAYKPNGDLNYVRGITNPFSYLQQQYKGTTVHFNTNANMRYEILQGLNLKASLGYATITLDQNSRFPASSKNNATAVQVSSASFANNSSRSYIIEPQLEYDRQILKGKLNALIGTTLQQNEAKGYSNTGTGYSNDGLLGVLSAASTTSLGNSYDFYRYNSIFGRLNYNWDGKYILSGTLRRDGSSKFGENYKFGTFGAVGAAYVFSEEELVKEKLPFLSYGKLRSSYGVTGNDQISNYQGINTYLTAGNSSAYQGTSIQYPARLANPDIRWERTKKFEGALELGFFKDRILLTAAYYRNISDNQIIYINTAGQVGFSEYLGNFDAKVENKGLEFEFTTTNIKSDNFTWTSSFNYTQSSTKLLSFPDLESSTAYKNQFVVGESPSLRRLYVYNGIDPATGKILYQTSNANGIPSFVTDQVVARVGHPYYGGLTNTFNYKQFELGFFLQFSHSYGSVNSVTGTLGSLSNQNSSTLNHWRNDGNQAVFPAPSQTANPVYNSYGFYYNSSTFFYQDASWLKLRNVNVAYQFPSRLTSKIKVSNLRVYGQAQNLWTITKNKYVYDPETGTSMPALRTMVIGLNASF